MTKLPGEFSQHSNPRRITLSHVAEDAGVSRATVSLVLRDSPLVSDATRERVLNSIQNLGYIYHRAAANLRTQRSQTVGLVVPDITNPFFAEMTVGIVERLCASNYIALLGNTSEMLDKQNHVLSVLQEFPADGLFLCP